MMTGFDMAKPIHKRINLAHVASLRGELKQPFAKGRVQRLPLGAGNCSGLFDQILVGA